MPHAPGPQIAYPTSALYKVATGEDIAQAPAPGMFDLKVRFGPLEAPPRR